MTNIVWEFGIGMKKGEFRRSEQDSQGPTTEVLLKMLFVDSSLLQSPNSGLPSRTSSPVVTLKQSVRPSLVLRAKP